MIKIKKFIAFTILAILALPSPAVADKSAMHKPQLYDYNGAPVSPLCFLNNIGTEDAPIYPTRRCDGEGLVDAGESPLSEDYVSVAYENHEYDVELEETFTSYGFIGYRAVGVTEEGYIATILVENGGGSGTFTTLFLLDPVRDESEETMNYHHKGTLAYGDRCMGGIKDARVTDGTLTFDVHTTMADMLLMTGDEERAILKSEAAESLPYCAACCYAVATFEKDALQSISFPENRLKPHEDSNEAAHCVENLIALNETHGQSMFDAEEFASLTREIEHVCLGRMEGE